MKCPPRVWAGFAIGLVMGMALIQAKTFIERQSLSREVHQLTTQVHHLQQETFRLRDHIATLNRKPATAPYVRSIDLEVIKNPVPLIDVEAALEIYTEPLLGMPLANLKLTMLYQLFEGRRIILDRKTYQVHVVGLIAAPEMTILLRLTRI